MIDPEALLLATMRCGRTDSRLTGEALDWLARNGRLMSLQRLKNVQLATRVADTEGLRDLADFMTEAGFRNWHSLDQWSSKTSTRSGGGFVPKGFQARGMSQAPDCGVAGAFILRLRALFGVSARPEVPTWLFTHRAGYAAEIARDVGWFSKSVQAILNELELSGLVAPFWIAETGTSGIRSAARTNQDHEITAIHTGRPGGRMPSDHRGPRLR